MTLDGPFPILDLSATPTLSTDSLSGATIKTYPLAAGVHYKTDPATLAAFTTLLTPYVVAPVHPLQNVWAGDDPATHPMTVPLVFPDQATADSVHAQIFPAP